MYVCNCMAVSERQVRQAAAEGCSSLKELTSELGVASCCGRCASHAKEVLHNAIADNSAPRRTLVGHFQPSLVSA